MKITTNYNWRNLLYGYELTAEQKAEFDYIDDIDSHDFIRYQGNIYDPSEFMAIPDCANQAVDDGFAEFRTWQGYHSDSFFSGILIRYSGDFEQVQVGRYCS